MPADSCIRIQKVVLEIHFLFSVLEEVLKKEKENPYFPAIHAQTFYPSHLKYSMNCNNLRKLTGITTYLSEKSLTLVWKCLHISTHLFLISVSTSICVKNLFATSSRASSGQAVNLETDNAIKNY